VIPLVMLVGLAALWLWPLELRLCYMQEGTHAVTELGLSAWPVRRDWRLDVSRLVSTAWEHIWTRWRETGEPVGIPLQERLRRFPVRSALQATAPPLRYLGAHLRCRCLQVATQVGGADAMETALLAGASWAMLGSALGWLTGFLRLEVAAPYVAVVPHYEGPCWCVRSRCILRLRLGHAIAAGVWLGFQVMRQRDLRTWLWESWRRKGVKAGG
jgi:hypothetical protein